MIQQIPISPSARADSGESHDYTLEVAPDLAYQRHAIVNVVYWGTPLAGDGNWVLIDAGVMGSMSAIERAANERYGPGARPSAIVLTHGHFDHVGVLEDSPRNGTCPSTPMCLRRLTSTVAPPIHRRTQASAAGSSPCPRLYSRPHRSMSAAACEARLDPR